MMTVINVGLMEIYSSYHEHEKIQEHELNQGHNKGKKS
jgi:hypothetical protein